MLVENKQILDKVEMLYPKLMAEDACEQFREKYSNLQKLKDEYWELKKSIMTLKEQIDASEIELHLLEKFFKITFKKEEIEEIKEETNMRIINDSDYRNHD